MPFRDAFAIAASSGLALQLQLEPPAFWFNPSQVEELRELRASYPDVALVLHAPYREMYMSSLYEDVRRAAVSVVKRSVDLAADLGASLVFHAGEANPLAPRDAATRAMRRSVEEILEYARERSVQAFLENAPFWKGSLLLYPSDFISLGIDVPICLDIPHAYASDTLDAFLDLLGDRVGIYHLSDTVRGKDLHLPLGKGEIPWKSVLSRLNRDVPWILEVGGDVAESLDFLRRMGF